MISEAKKWMERIAEKQRQPRDIPTPDERHHQCLHCGYHFVGRLCPQCGMPAVWKRFTWKRLFFNFLDLWGMGNRPMFRSLGDLLWRPGYMIRDYLSGHYLSYFPPFKMLAILTLIVALIGWVMDVSPADHTVQVFNAFNELLEDASPQTIMLFDYIKQAWQYISEHVLYRIILLNVLVVLCVWIVFRKRGYNLVETFFSQIYINCQMQMVAIVLILLTGQWHDAMPYPYAIPYRWAFLILVYDFHQLYDMNLWSALWRCALVTLLLIFVLIFSILLLVVIPYVLSEAVVHGFLS